MDYSYLTDDIWEHIPPRQEYEEKNPMDDIMTAYTDQNISLKEKETLYNFEGYSPMQHMYFELKDMYTKDIKSMENNIKEKVVAEETCSPSVDVHQSNFQEPVIETIVETFSPNQSEQKYLHLLIFLICGILLIFIFDKLIDLGRALKK